MGKMDGNCDENVGASGHKGTLISFTFWGIYLSKYVLLIESQNGTLMCVMLI